MKNKFLNTFSVKSNDEEIKIDVIQTDKGIVLDVLGTSMDIFVNKEEVYSKYNNPNYSQIPSQIRPFIEKNINPFGDDIFIDKGKVCCDITISSDYYVQIPTNKAKCKDIFMHNWLNDYSKIEEELDVSIPNAEENFNKLLKNIESFGYRFEFSWDGNEYDVSYKLIVPICDFNEEKILKCMQLWEDYNNSLEKYIK